MHRLFDTPVGKLNAPDLADAVMDRLMRFRTNIPPSQNVEVSLSTISQVLLNVISTLDSTQRGLIQTFLSNATPVKRSVGSRLDPRLRQVLDLVNNNTNLIDATRYGSTNDR